MDIISLYSGADNLGDGIIQAGGKIKICVEQDKDCCETIKINHPDIEVINGLVSEYVYSLPKVDCIVGGPPCPEFSRANPKRTMDLCEVDNFNLVRELTKSKFYFMENVRDLAKVHPERNFLINCADYGVPQTRIRRIFTNLNLPDPTHSKDPIETIFGKQLKKWVSVKDALNLDDESWFSTPTGFKTANKKQLSNSVNQPIMTIVNGNDYNFTDGPKMSEKYKEFKNNYNVIRKLTNEELAILQGFREDFKFFGGKTSVRKQIGNALPAIISKSFFMGII